jgi:hypothetical protein
MELLPVKLKVTGTGIPKLYSSLIERNGKVCLYERSDSYYEVFIVQVSPAVLTFGKFYPEREVYPGNDDFGKTAWCFRDKDNAYKQFRRLVESHGFSEDPLNADTNYHPLT